MIVTGRLRQPTVDGKQGRRRVTIEIDAEDVVVPLIYATALTTKTFRTVQTARTPARLTAEPPSGSDRVSSPAPGGLLARAQSVDVSPVVWSYVPQAPPKPATHRPRRAESRPGSGRAGSTGREYPEEREEILLDAADCWSDAGQHDRALALYQRLLDMGCEEPHLIEAPHQHPVGRRP